VVIKEKTNTCQVAVPGDFKPQPMDASTYNSPDQKISVQIFANPGPVKPVSEVVAKAMKIDKFFENTPARVFYAEQAVRTTDGKTLTAWKSKVPRAGGTCWTNIVFQPGSPEDLMKKIAGTVGPVK
jgi:hypothetical protein